MLHGRHVLPTIAIALCAVPATADAADPAATTRSMERAMKLVSSGSGALVVDVASGRELLSVRPDTRRIPASVNKLYTTSASLLRWGAGGRLSTDVVATAAPDRDGIVHGDVILRGGGDPSLTHAGIRNLAQAIAERGITEITGDVLGDESLFDTRRGPPSSRYKPSAYVGILSALTLDLNLTAAKRLQRAPARAAATDLHAQLRRAGVKLGGRPGRGTAPAGARTLASATSPTMAALTQATNRPSSNFYAETLLKTLGARFGGAGSTPAGAAVVRSTVARFDAHPRIVDGSGLSRSDRTSPREVVRLLTGMARTPQASAFDASLAVAGRNGTLRRRMRGSAAAGNCHAKTGTLSSVSSLAGYCRTADGGRVAFALLMNRTSAAGAHAAQDRIARALAALRLGG